MLLEAEQLIELTRYIEVPDIRRGNHRLQDGRHRHNVRLRRAVGTESDAAEPSHLAIEATQYLTRRYRDTAAVFPGASPRQLQAGTVGIYQRPWWTTSSIGRRAGCAIGRSGRSSGYPT